MIVRDKEYIERLLNIAQKCCQESNFTTALDCYHKVLELQPNKTDIYLKLGDIFKQQQQLDRAVGAYQQAIELQPKQPPWIYQTLGSLLIEQRQPERAIALYQNAIELHPNCASEFYVKIGDIYSQQNKFFIAKSFWHHARSSRILFNVDRIVDCIERYFPDCGKLRAIDILDNGCEHTGQQLALLAEQTTGRVVGTNIYPGFPTQTVKRRRINNEFYAMDGQDLTFPTASFDLVISVNILEHVAQPDRYLQECYRVLRPGGIGFFSWYPVWSGATGHHIHPDMVSRRAQQFNIIPPNYGLDGNSIPFWGHLLFGADRMLSFLIEEQKYNSALATWMRDYIYYGSDLNRWFWRDIRQLFCNLAWNTIEEEHQGKKPMSLQTKKQLSQKYGDVSDFAICGAKIIVRK